MRRPTAVVAMGCEGGEQRPKAVREGGPTAVVERGSEAADCGA